MRTSSERAFESFLADNNLAFKRIKEEASSRPDYLVEIGELKLVFEVKELAKDKNFSGVNEPSGPITRIHSRTVGEHVRRKIHAARKQIQFAAYQGLPSILLIYNNLDPLHLFGTEDHDFLHGMYGELTLLIDKRTGQARGGPFYGRKAYVSEIKNTSFSAVGRLKPHLGKMSVTLFENTFSKVRIPYEQLPPCFDVKRVEVPRAPATGDVLSRAEFLPPWWLRNPHLQTIATLWPRRFPGLPAAETRLVEVEAGSRVRIECHWQPNRQSCPTLVLLHGLEGSSESPYMLGAAEKAWRAGFNAVRMNLRNCGGTEHLTPTLYNAGLSGDLARVVEDLVKREGLAEIHLSGTSMGGNIVLKLAGEWGSEAPPQVAGFSAVSPSLDLGLAADAINRPSNFLYQWRFVRGLKAKFRHKARLHPQTYRTDGMEEVHSLREFDDRFTAPHSGYGNAANYYHRASALRVTERISLPTLILTAQDDPFIPFESFRNTALTQNSNLILLTPPHGGHAGFISSRIEKEDCFWAENRVVEFAQYSYRLLKPDSLDSLLRR